MATYVTLFYRFYGNTIVTLQQLKLMRAKYSSQPLLSHSDRFTNNTAIHSFRNLV